MKKIITLLFLLLAVASATRAQIGYQPLVRENVRWICYDFDLIFGDDQQDAQAIFNFYSYEFIGDSVLFEDQLGTRFRYKKLFRQNLYTITDYYEKNQVTFDFENQGKPKLCALMRESDKKVYVPGCTSPNESDWTAEHYATGYPLYNFSSKDSAIVGEYYGDFSSNYCASFTYAGTVKIDGINCRKYLLPGDDFFSVIEGVGYDGDWGDLLQPNAVGVMPTCPCDRRLVCLVDQDGIVLYKGSAYASYINLMRHRADISGDGRVDVADINAAVSAVMGVGDKAKADVNGDGKVDIADINAVLNVMLNR